MKRIFRKVIAPVVTLAAALAILQLVGRAATLPTGFSEALIAGGLTNPTAMAFAPDGRLFVCLQGGQLRVIKNDTLLAAPFVKGVSTHGTGCVYSAAIAGYLALGFSLPRAVGRAKRYVTGAIAGSAIAGGHAVLNHFWEHAR